jgi:hypothetical protein
MMALVAPEALAQAFARIAPELGLDGKASAAALRAAVREADHLVDDIYDVPGALLFAFGRNSRCFRGFRAMSILAVEWHTKSLGFKLEATRPELASVLTRVAAREVDYDEVRAWVANRLFPFGG